MYIILKATYDNKIQPSDLCNCIVMLIRLRGLVIDIYVIEVWFTIPHMRFQTVWCEFTRKICSVKSTVWWCTDGVLPTVAVCLCVSDVCETGVKYCSCSVVPHGDNLLQLMLETSPHLNITRSRRATEGMTIDQV